MTLAIVMLISFAAAAATMLAVGLAARDLTVRRYSAVDRRLGLGVEADEAMGTVSALPPVAPGRIDRFFYSLIEESGTRLSVPAALALVAGLAAIGLATGFVITENPLVAAATLVVGPLLPIAWWSLRRMRRRAAMRKFLPETFDMLADGVRSGRNLEQAAQLVARQAPQPLRTEFAYCASQLRLGHTATAVLERMVRRIALPEFKIFATAVLVHRIAGGNLAILIERLAQTARDRQEFHGHLRATTAGSRLSAIGLFVGTLAAVGILAWLEPEYLEVFLSNHLGVPLLAIAAALQVVGLIWLWRIVKVDY